MRPSQSGHLEKKMISSKNLSFFQRSTLSRASIAKTRNIDSINAGSSSNAVRHGTELTDDFADVICENNLLTVAGFGSLLSETSARSTFPELQNFRLGHVSGYRRLFGHGCSIFFDRGIARPETKEISSLSVEPHADSEIVVTLFEIDAGNPDVIRAFIQREHEFRFCAVVTHQVNRSNGSPAKEDRPAVICARNTDENYRQTRCPPEEWERRYGKHGLTSIWRDDVLPCRVYLRHCVLAATKLGSIAEASFLDGTVLADRTTTVREWLEKNPEIMDELPPPSLAQRYAG